MIIFILYEGNIKEKLVLFLFKLQINLIKIKNKLKNEHKS